MIQPSILPGFMELLPEEQKVMEQMKKDIQSVYEKNGCYCIDTPILEKAEVLLAKSAGETEKQVYQFTKGKNDIAMRFDLTVPFARYTAQHYNDLAFPLKRYQIGKVYRGEKSQKGRYREFYQCDVDVVAKDELSIRNDAWIISLMNQAFTRLNIPAYKFMISNRKILNGLFEELRIENKTDVMILIDKYEKIGETAFELELASLVSNTQANIIKKVIICKDNNIEIINSLKEMKIDNNEFNKGIEELDQLISLLPLLGVNNTNFKINLSIIRGLDYYTGTVFETFLEQNEQYGSICSGGRYDHLIDLFSKNSVQGVGASIGLTRLFYILKECEYLNQMNCSSKEFLIYPLGNTLKECLELNTKIQKAGYNSSVYFESVSLKKFMSYADKTRIDYAIILGEDEIASNQFMVKDMMTHQSNKVSIDELFMQ